MLVPYTWLINRYDAKLRETLLEEFSLSELVYMCKNVFPDAPDAIPLMVIANKTRENLDSDVLVKVLNPDLLNQPTFLSNPLVDTVGSQTVWRKRELIQISVYDTETNHPVFEAMEIRSKPLREYGWASDGIYKSTVEKHKKPKATSPEDKPVIESASQTHRYIIEWEGSYIDQELWTSHTDLHSGEKFILHAARKPTMSVRIVVAYSTDEIYFSNRFIIVKPYENNTVVS